MVSIASRSTLVVEQAFNPPITSNTSYKVRTDGPSRGASAYKVQSIKGSVESDIGSLPASGAIVDQVNVLPNGLQLMLMLRPTAVSLGLDFNSASIHPRASKLS